MKLYESIENSLSKLVNNVSESLLNEKKQEMSPEDEHDNKLLKSVLRKVYSGHTDLITPEERSAMTRNGLDTDYWGLSSATGSIDVRSVDNGLSGSRSFESKDEIDRINIADMGRKAKQRHDYHAMMNDWAAYRPNRGSKKTYIDDYDRIKSSSFNLLNLERQALNRKLQQNVDNLKKNLQYRKDKQKAINREYEQEDKYREVIINEIKKLKKELANLEDETSKRVDVQKDYYDKNEKDIRRLLDDKRKELEDKKKKRNESLVNEKFERMSPEDKRDSELILRAIRSAGAKPTEDELDALRRNEYGYNDSTGSIYSGTGYAGYNGNYFSGIVDSDDYEIPIYSKKADKINFAKLGRIQKERASKYKDGKQYAKRHRKKGAYGNKLTNDRYLQNYRMQDDINMFNSIINDRTADKNRLRQLDDERESTRDYLIKQISSLKKQLASVDSEYDERIERQKNYINQETQELNDKLKARRQKLEKRREERKNENK